MKKITERKVRIRFKNKQEAITLFIQIELIHFLAKLLHTRPICIDCSEHEST